MVYAYDGTFPGFLSVVYAAYHDGTGQVEGIRRETEPQDLFYEEKWITTDFGHAQKVASSFYERCGRAASQWLYRGFLFDGASGENVLFSYMKLGFRLRKEVYAHRMEDPVWQVFQWASAAGDEAGKFLGLVRFSELAEGTLYAEIRPTHNIVPLLANHFRRRLGERPWAIHDIGRRHVVYCDGKSLVFANMTAQDTLEYSSQEMKFRKLWQGYYQHMAIQERYNPALRRSFMPEKYWECLTEMQVERPKVNG